MYKTRQHLTNFFEHIKTTKKEKKKENEMKLLATYYSIATCLSFTSMITLPASFGGYLVDQQSKLINWFLRDLDVFIKEYSSYLINFIFILFTYLFILCYLCLFLLILLILLFAAVDVIVAYSLFNSVECSCSGSSIYFAFLLVIKSLLFILLRFIHFLSLLCIYFCSSFVS